MSQALAKALGLADGLPAGAARLSDLPEEGPEDQAQGPAPLAGKGFFFARSQAERTNPGAEEGFQLVQGGAIGAAETTKVGGKTARPEREVGSIH